MRVLIGFECSGEVRDAFLHFGHDAWSCDLQPSRRYGPHLQCDILKPLVEEKWDLLIAHPPCDHLASSGARWFHLKRREQAQAISLIKFLWQLEINKIAIENPIGILSSRFRKPSQIIQPHQFGHGELKATCLWLKNLPKLIPTINSLGREQRVWREPPGKDRKLNRSKTYSGIAFAMAEQWG